MKRLLSGFLGCALLGMASIALAEVPLISVSQFIEHPALNAVLQGVKDDLKENGVEVKYKEYNAQGNMGTTGQIAVQIASDSPDIILAIATPSAQACARIYDKAPQLAETPMLFTAITDPIAAGLVDSYEKPEANITGVSNQMPMDKHLDMLKRFLPGLQRLGVLYNTGEVNSVSNVKRIKIAAKERGIKILDGPVTSSADVFQATQSLVGKVDAIYIPTDSTVISALEAVVKISERTQLPLFVADTDSVERGAIAALGFDYYLHGRQTGVMLRKLLAGASPSDLPVEFQKDLSFHLNPKAAERMGLVVDQAIIDSADVIHE